MDKPIFVIPLLVFPILISVVMLIVYWDAIFESGHWFWLVIYPVIIIWQIIMIIEYLKFRMKRNG